MKWLNYAREAPLWAYVATAALVTFATFFCALLPLSGKDRNVGDKRYESPLCERTYEPLGSSEQWRDTECYPWHINASAHLYRADSNSAPFAYFKDGLSTTTPIYGGITQSVPHKWKWGFSVMAGRQLYHYDWNLNAEYQYFASKVSQKVASEGSSALIPLQGIALNGTSVTRAQSQNSLLLNQLDVDIDKRFHFRENVLLNMGTGVRTTWLKNNDNSQYAGGDTLSLNTLSVRQSNQYWGIGPLAAMRARWLCSKIFYLTAESDASLEYTVYHARYNERQSNVTSATINMYDKASYLAPSLALRVGAGFADYAFCDDAHVSLDLTYDAQFFWRRGNTLQAEPFSTTRFVTQSGDFSLQGFALTLSVSY